MKQPGLYYFESIKMSLVKVNREYLSAARILRTKFDYACDVIFIIAVSLPEVMLSQRFGKCGCPHI